MQHFMVAWQAEAESEKQIQIFDQLARCLSDWENYRIFPHCAVVQVGGNGHYEAVLKKLKACAAEFPSENQVQFVMTPLKERGLYNGRMAATTADALNRLSE